MSKGRRTHHPDSYLKPIVERLILRVQGTWTGVDARCLTCIVLAKQDIELDKKLFQKLVHAVHVLGKSIPLVPGAESSVHWDIKDIKTALGHVLVDSEDPAVTLSRTTVLKHLASRVREFTFVKKHPIDWIFMINTILIQTGCEDAFLNLEDKCDLAEQIEKILVVRRNEINRNAEAVTGRSLDEFVSELGVELEGRRAVPPSTPVSSRQLNAGATELKAQFDLPRLIPHVHPNLRPRFIKWFGKLSSNAKIAVARRIERVAEDPGKPNWIKGLVTHGFRGHLFEVKVLSQGIRLRIIYRVCESGTAEILAFGLRRDLNRLVEEAKRAASN